MSSPKPNFHYEVQALKLNQNCVGVDEVGRGCLAGPVVTAAVYFPPEILQKKRRHPWIKELDDSKKIPEKKRKELSLEIQKHTYYQIAWSLVPEIDAYNILHASMIAMRRALWPFQGLGQVVLVDGNQSPFRPLFRCPEDEAGRLGFKEVKTLVKGDRISSSIAAASIVAKVYRDEWMHELSDFFPGYFFHQHKGYSTKQHLKALDEKGPCAIHRKSFDPIKVKQENLIKQALPLLK